MLVLSRKPGESIVIDGRIIVKVVRVEGDIVKLGIDAPVEVPVHRQEVYDEIQKSNVEALTKSRPALPRLAPKPPAPAPALSVTSPDPSSTAAKPKIIKPATRK